MRLWTTMDQGFSPRELAALTRAHGAMHARPGTVLFDVGSSDVEEFILLQGELELRSKSGVVRHVRGGEPQARLPLAKLRPRQFTGKALTQIRFLRLTDAAIRSALRRPEEEAPPVDAGYEVVEMLHGGEDDAQSLFVQFVGAVARDEVRLPSLPAVATQVREAIAAQAGTKEVARIINIDAAIAAKVMRTANSPVYRGEKPSSTVGDAVARVGVENTQKLVVTIALREVFDAKAPALKSHMRTLWRHTQMVASGAFVLARSLKRINAESALLAGLLHEVGAVALLAHAEHFPEVFRDAGTLARVLDELKGEAGSMVLARWSFEPALVRLPKEVDDWQREAAQFDECALLQLVHYCMLADEDDTIDPPAAIALAGVSREELREQWVAAAPSLKLVQQMLGD
ncbi:MAG: HDOD domain-containing protein [Gammaproteobacteria bacterium]|nr:HDOD domain-containing protein [Gammaproteobacteria bacterium]